MTEQQEFDSLPFLNVDDQPLSWQQSLGYLWLFGQLRPLIQSIVSQHIIYQEIKQRDDLEVGTAEFEQAVIDFRLQQKLNNPDNFQTWLAREGMDYAAFQNRVVLNLKVEKLSAKIAEGKLSEYFEKRKNALELLELSCLIVEEQTLAEELKNRLLNKESSFEQVAQTEATKVRIARRSARKQQWPQELQNSLTTAKEQDIIGPLFLENKWCVFQIEKITPPVLEGQLKRSLEAQIFKEWLEEKVNKLKIQLVGNQSQEQPS